MTAIEAIQIIKYRIETASEIVGKGKDGKAFQDLEIAIQALEKQITEKPKYKWHMTFQKCDRYGGYCGNNDWFDVTIYANNKSEAVLKAKTITECDYIRALKCEVVEE